jgi:hypothetical protein
MLDHHRQATLRSASVSDLQTTYVNLAEHLHEEGVGERLEIPRRLEVGQWGAAPKRKRIAEPIGGLLRRCRGTGRGEGALKLREVEPLGVDPVAALARRDHVPALRAKCPAQVRDVHLQCLVRGHHRVVAPQRVDQRLLRDDLAGAQQENARISRCLGRRISSSPAVVAHLEWAQVPNSSATG